MHDTERMQRGDRRPLEDPFNRVGDTPPLQPETGTAGQGCWPPVDVDHFRPDQMPGF